MLKKHYYVPRVTTLPSFLLPNHPPHGDNSLFTTPHLSRDSSSSICALNFEWTLSLLPPFHSPFCSNNIATGQSLSALSLSLHPFGEYKITLLTVAERWERSRCPASLEIPWKHIRFWDDKSQRSNNTLCNAVSGTIMLSEYITWELIGEKDGGKKVGRGHSPTLSASPVKFYAEE